MAKNKAVFNPLQGVNSGQGQFMLAIKIQFMFG